MADEKKSTEKASWAKTILACFFSTVAVMITAIVLEGHYWIALSLSVVLFVLLVYTRSTWLSTQILRVAIIVVAICLVVAVFGNWMKRAMPGTAKAKDNFVSVVDSVLSIMTDQRGAEARRMAVEHQEVVDSKLALYTKSILAETEVRQINELVDKGKTSLDIDTNKGEAIEVLLKKGEEVQIAFQKAITTGTPLERLTSDTEAAALKDSKQSDTKKPSPQEIYVDRGESRNFCLSQWEATPWISKPAGVDYVIEPPKGTKYTVFFEGGGQTDVVEGETSSLPDVRGRRYKVMNTTEQEVNFVISSGV